MKRLRFWITLLIAIVIAVLGLLTAYNWWLAQPIRQVAEEQTSPVVRGAIRQVVRAYGQVSAPDAVVVNPAISGRVREVFVKVGDTVRAGDVLARLETEDLEAAVRQAEMALRTSEAQLARTRAGASPEYLRVLEAGVAVAQARLLTAQATVDGARAYLAGVRKGPSAETIAIAERRVEEAKNALWGAQAQRDAICGRVRDGAGQAECDGAQASALRAEENVRIAELQLQQLKAGVEETTLQSAQSQLNAALGQLKTAEAQVAQAEAELERAKAGPLKEDIAVAEAQVAAAQVALEEAKRRLAGAEITAPVEGTVINVPVSVGQAVSMATPIVTLQDLNALYVRALVNELYIPQVQPGQRVLVRLEADPSSTIEGSVRQISPLPSLTAGLANYDVHVDIPQTEALRPGMTAELQIITAEKADALLIPREALIVEGSAWAVRVLRQGQIAIVPVETGLRQGRLIEVKDGLQEGERVVTATTSLGTERGDYVWLPLGIMWRAD